MALCRVCTCRSVWFQLGTISPPLSKCTKTRPKSPKPMWNSRIWNKQFFYQFAYLSFFFQFFLSANFTSIMTSSIYYCLLSIPIELAMFVLPFRLACVSNAAKRSASEQTEHETLVRDSDSECFWSRVSSTDSVVDLCNGGRSNPALLRASP